jgi:SAM-dependent methyltransferase
MMPSLDTTLHVDMLWRGKRSRTLFQRLKNAARVLLKSDIYGLEWGDPDKVPPLRYVRDHYLAPYATPDSTVVEIGPGGGRWTRYMLGARHVYAVDFHQELLDTVKANVRSPRLTFIRNNGDDFPGIPAGSIDFVYSFGTFVHLDIDIIGRYLANIKALLRPGANVVIHYSDMTKPLGRSNKGFSENDPEKMIALVKSHGYTVYEEDRGTLWHSSIVRFGLVPTM